ncbi:MAG: hypothetical protein M3N16_00430 [Actinomycetota bacterium]|nr:hypothetical protein [Actinomycetota bacterium]
MTLRERRNGSEVGERGRQRPAFVVSPQDRRRWELAEATAVELTGEPPTSESVWYLARSIYRSPIPTDG